MNRELRTTNNRNIDRTLITDLFTPTLFKIETIEWSQYGEKGNAIFSNIWEELITYSPLIQSKPQRKLKNGSGTCRQAERKLSS
jgi:hypothetical protein